MAALAPTLWLAGCGSSDPGTAAPTTDVVPATTTIPVLERPVIDACGNDLGDLTSTVVAVDAASGSEAWRATVPLAEAYLLRDPSGDPRLSLVLRPVDAVLDAGSGELVATPDAGVHEVLVDPAGSTGSGVGGLLVDGEEQPAEISVDAVVVSTAAGSTGQSTVGLTGSDPTTGATAWRVELGPADQVASLSPPVRFGDVRSWWWPRHLAPSAPDPTWTDASWAARARVRRAQGRGTRTRRGGQPSSRWRRRRPRRVSQAAPTRVSQALAGSREPGTTS